MSRMFSSTARVWARMSSTVRPLASRCAPAMESSARRALVPDTKMKSPARRKCGKVPRGRALPATTALSARAAARPASSALMRAIPPPAPLELHADVHGLGEEAERVRPALTADARELHPAEGRAQVAQIPVIDPGDAHFQLPGYAMGALQIRGPHGSGQPIAGVVRQLHRLLFGIERRHVADGTEDLLLDAARSFREAAHDGRLDEGAAIALITKGRHAAATDDFAVLLARQAVVGQNFLAVRARDQRSQVRALVRPADLERARPCAERLHEALEDRALYVDALGAQAHLPAVGEHRAHGAAHGRLEVRVCKHHGGVLAAELERQRLHRVR